MDQNYPDGTNAFPLLARKSKFGPDQLWEIAEKAKMAPTQVDFLPKIGFSVMLTLPDWPKWRVSDTFLFQLGQF